jgi:hypothetical protein
MRKGSSEPGPAPPPGAADEATRTFLGRDPVSRLRQDDPANLSPQAQAVVVQSHVPTDVVRHGPGVPATPPAGQAELTAERVWRSSRHTAKTSRRTARLRRLFGSALTVILLAAAGLTLYLRFHDAPFRVTGVVISQQARTGCGVDVTGRITTNGSAGTVSYQWLFRPDVQAPQPLSQSVIAGQQAVYVTAAVEGTGHGSEPETVTLQVLGPELTTASTAVVVSCR